MIILKDKTNIYITGNTKMQVHLKDFSSKQTPQNNWQAFQPKVILLRHNVYTNINFSSVARYFFCSHHLHIPENLRPAAIVAAEDLVATWMMKGQEIWHLLGWGTIHNNNIKSPLGIINHGCHIVDHLIEEAFQVGVIGSLDEALEELKDENMQK